MGKIKELGFDENNIDTVLAKDIKFKGTLKFSKSLMIKGNFTGDIIAENGHLFIENGATVKANIKAEKVSNKGNIKGNTEVSDKFELFSEGAVNGDISSSELYVERGSFFNGKSKMVSEK